MLLRHIRYFLAVAEHRNFTRAAEALHVSQPTLSQQIRQLEDTLHAPLLDRSGRAIVLTDAGVAYLGYARRSAGPRSGPPCDPRRAGAFPRHPARGDDADLYGLPGRQARRNGQQALSWPHADDP